MHNTRSKKRTSSAPSFETQTSPRLASCGQGYGENGQKSKEFPPLDLQHSQLNHFSSHASRAAVLWDPGPEFQAKMGFQHVQSIFTHNIPYPFGLSLALTSPSFVLSVREKKTKTFCGSNYPRPNACWTALRNAEFRRICVFLTFLLFNDFDFVSTYNHRKHQFFNFCEST